MANIKVLVMLRISGHLTPQQSKHLTVGHMPKSMHSPALFLELWSFRSVISEYIQNPPFANFCSVIILALPFLAFSYSVRIRFLLLHIFRWFCCYLFIHLITWFSLQQFVSSVSVITRNRF